MKRLLPTSLTALGVVAGLSLVSAMVAPSADAAAISVNIFPDNGQAADVQLAPTENAGVVSGIDNWNNFGPFADNAAGRTSGTLTDDSGNATTATITSSASGVTTARTFADPPDPNVRLMNGFAELASLTFNDIPTDFVASGYNLYAYYEDNSKIQTTTVSATVGSTTFFGRDDTTYDSADDRFIRALATTDDAAVDANYFLFEGLTGSSVTVSFAGNGREPITGIQLVQVPEPASLALVGLGSMLILARRRKA